MDRHRFDAGPDHTVPYVKSDFFTFFTAVPVYMFYISRSASLVTKFSTFWTVFWNFQENIIV